MISCKRVLGPVGGAIIRGRTRAVTVRALTGAAFRQSRMRLLVVGRMTGREVGEGLSHLMDMGPRQPASRVRRVALPLPRGRVEPSMTGASGLSVARKEKCWKCRVSSRAV